MLGIPKNTIFRTTDEVANQFEVIGEPNFRQQTSTWIEQDIEFMYNTEAEAGNDLWDNTGILRYDPEEETGFLPFGVKLEVVDKLPLNHTFRNTKYMPSGAQHFVEVNNLDCLELRKLVLTERSRETVERVELPSEARGEQDQPNFNWWDEQIHDDVPYTNVYNSWSNNGANPEYVVDVPICKFGRTLIGYAGETISFNNCPMIQNASMRTLRFTFNWETGTFQYPGGRIVLGTRDVRWKAPVEGNIIGHKNFSVYVPPLETKPVNAKGYAVWGPDHSTRDPTDAHNPFPRTYGYKPVDLTGYDPKGESRLVSESVQLIQINRALDAGNYLAPIVNQPYSIAEEFAKTNAFLAIPYFQIPFGRRTSRGRPPLLNPVNANLGANPPIPAYPGIGFSPTYYPAPSWNLLRGLAVNHDGLPNSVQVYARFKATVANDFGAGQVYRHAFFVQFPYAVPAYFVADHTFFATFQKDAGAGDVPTYLEGITPNAADVNTWIVLDGGTNPTLAAYNAANVGQPVGQAPPPAVAGSVIILYVKEMQFIANNQARLALPSSNMLEDAAVPQTNLVHFDNAAANFSRNRMVGQVMLQGQQGAEVPFIRTGFTISCHEPFYSYPSGLSCYPDAMAPWDKIPKWLPLLIQNSTTRFERTTGELNRCIRLLQPGSLTAELKGTCKLGRYLQDDVQQSEKQLSIINLAVPRLEHYSTRFTSETGDFPDEKYPTIKIQSTFGLPELLFIRIKQLFTEEYTVPAKDFLAKIESLSYKIFGYENSLLNHSPVGHKQLREITRQNSHVFSAKQEYAVLLSLKDIGAMNNPRQSERVELELKLTTFSQHAALSAVEKEFIVVPIYNVEALQGTAEELHIQKYYRS